MVVVVVVASLLLLPSPTGVQFAPDEDAGDVPTTTATGPADGDGTDEDISAKPGEATDPGTTGASSRGGAGGAEEQPFDGTIHEVADVGGWRTAVAAARPGDVIELVADIDQPISYRGPRSPNSRAEAVDGTAEQPITIRARPGVWIDPGNLSNQVPGLDVIGAAFVDVVGINVRNSQFGIRLQRVEGSAERPVLLSGNTVTDIGHAGIHVAGELTTHAPSRHVRVEGNTVTRTGQTAPQFGEGIYLGYGSREWVDTTSSVAVVGNQISFTTAEAVDVKPGTSDILVEGNAIHDLSPISGGAISAHYVGNAPNPDPGRPANILVRGNRIWNLNLDGRSGANDWAIWVGHGGVTIEGNTIWGLRGNPDQTRAVRVRGLHDFGPHPIRIVDNVFWTATGWMAEGSPSAAHLVQASGNQGPAGAAGVEVALAAGPEVPALGSGGTADSGHGPGSALGALD